MDRALMSGEMSDSERAAVKKSLANPYDRAVRGTLGLGALMLFFTYLGGDWVLVALVAIAVMVAARMVYSYGQKKVGSLVDRATVVPSRCFRVQSVPFLNEVSHVSVNFFLPSGLGAKATVGVRAPRHLADGLIDQELPLLVTQERPGSYVVLGTGNSGWFIGRQTTVERPTV